MNWAIIFEDQLYKCINKFTLQNEKCILVLDTVIYFRLMRMIQELILYHFDLCRTNMALEWKSEQNEDRSPVEKLGMMIDQKMIQSLK